MFFWNVYFVILKFSFVVCQVITHVFEPTLSCLLFTCMNIYYLVSVQNCVHFTNVFDKWLIAQTLQKSFAFVNWDDHKHY